MMSMKSDAEQYAIAAWDAVTTPPREDEDHDTYIHKRLVDLFLAAMVNGREK